MDKYFMEFWGNFLISAAKGERQLDEMARWIDQDFSGLEDFLESGIVKSPTVDEVGPDH